MPDRFGGVLQAGDDDLLDHALDLPTIDLDGPVGVHDAVMVALDRRTYEDRYAELGFGLGVVPRRRGGDDPWWETPAGLLAAVGALLLLLWAAV